MSDTRATLDQHVESEQLAAYVDGALSGDEQARVEKHLSSCDDCYHLFVETRAFLEENAQQTRGGQVLPFWSRHQTWWLGGLAAAAAAVLLAVPLGLMDLALGPDPRANLVSAVGTSRVIEPRLTGGFAWGPVPPVMRSGNQPDASLDLRAAALELERDALESDAVEVQAAHAAAQLLLGAVQTALPLLESVVQRQPGVAQYHSDLAAAHLVRGRPEDAAAALAAADTALDLDPALPEALYNRALALEAFSRFDEAQRAWSDYLSVDPGSDWATEAAERD